MRDGRGGSASEREARGRRKTKTDLVDDLGGGVAERIAELLSSAGLGDIVGTTVK